MTGLSVNLGSVAVSALVGGIGGALVSAAARLWETKIEQREENQRLKADYYVEEKVQSLIALHSALESANQTYESKRLNLQANEFTREDYEEAIERFDALVSGYYDASLFLTTDQRQRVGDCLNAFRKANTTFSQAKESNDVSADRYPKNDIFNQYRKVSEMLRSEAMGPIEGL